MTKAPRHRKAQPLQVKPSNRNTFVYTLFDILTSAYYGFLKWSDDGRRVIITDSSKLTREVLTRHYQTEKLTSFTRQFHLYGFKRNSDGRKNKDKKGYVEWVHRYFQRGRYDYLQHIKRGTQPKGALKATPEHKLESHEPQPRFPAASSSTPVTFANLSGHEQSTDFALANHATGAPPATVTYPRLPPLDGRPSLSPTLPNIAGLSLTLQPPPPPPLRQPALPFAAAINADQQMIDMLRQQSPRIHEFQTPQAQEIMHALQLLYDNHGRVAPEVAAFAHGQLDSICQSIEGISDGPLRERVVQAVPQPIAINAKAANEVPQNMLPRGIHQLDMLAPQNAPGLPSANNVLAFGSASQRWSLPSSGHASHFTNSMSQRASSFHVPAPIITSPDNMSHLLAYKGVYPQDHQDFLGNISAASKMSLATPHTPVASGMFSASHMHQFGGASLMPMAANMFGVAPQSAGCQVTAASSNSDSIPQQLGGFSVADIYLQPPLTFGGCPGILDVTMEAPTPLFMNANSFAINSPSVATSDPWSTTGTSARTARNEPTLTPEQSQCNTPGLAPKSHM